MGLMNYVCTVVTVG